MELPTKFVTGRIDCQVRRRKRFIASMEPPTNVSGWRGAPLWSVGSDASMEPPTNVSGCLTPSWSEGQPHRFNGAAHERERMRYEETRQRAYVHASIEPPTNVSGCRPPRVAPPYAQWSRPQT